MKGCEGCYYYNSIFEKCRIISNTFFKLAGFTCPCQECLVKAMCRPDRRDNCEEFHYNIVKLIEKHNEWLKEREANLG